MEKRKPREKIIHPHMKNPRTHKIKPAKISRLLKNPRIISRAVEQNSAGYNIIHSFSVWRAGRRRGISKSWSWDPSCGRRSRRR